MSNLKGLYIATRPEEYYRPYPFTMISVRYGTVQCSAVQCSAVQYTTLHYTTLHYTTLHYTYLEMPKPFQNEKT